MLTGLKVSFLACKCVFYRPEHYEWEDPMVLNFEGLATNRAQILDENNKVICLVIMLTPRVMSLKAHFQV